MNRPPRIFLTGGRGMVGRNIIEHPLSSAFEWHAPGRQDLDLTCKQAVRDYISDVRPDLVIHAAGKVGGISANIADPYGFLVENLEVGINVVAAAAAAGVPRLLNLGSSCIYPKDVDGFLREDMILSGPLEPTNEGYALAKIAALRLCQFATANSAGRHYKTLIPCNLFGPHDKFDPHQAHLIPAIIRKVHEAKVSGSGTVEIWGDGTARREFMFAADLAEAVLRAAHDFDSLPDIMNVGVGRDHTVLEYYEAVAAVVGWRGSFTFDLSKPAGMRRKIVDVTRQTTWGWSPTTTLEVGIRATYDFYLRNYAQ